MIFLWFKWVLTIKMFCLINNKQVPRQMNVLNIYSFNPDSPFWLHVENFPFSATVWVFWPFCGQMRSSSLSTVHPPPPPPPFRLSPSVCWVSRFFFFRLEDCSKYHVQTLSRNHTFLSFTANASDVSRFQRQISAPR